MRYSPVLVEIRFGCGLSPEIAPPRNVHEMLDGLIAPDEMARAHPIPGFGAMLPVLRQQRALLRARRRSEDEAERADLRTQHKALLRQSNRTGRNWWVQAMVRQIRTETAFRERLVLFWTDHFAALGKTPVFRHAALPYAEEAIRPYVAGRFADLLKAVTTHPLMLHYLDQVSSMGPNSRTAKRSDRQRGLNENLARELLELHTLGVNGPYDQNDIRALAELLAGRSYDFDNGFKYRRRFAEPGAETVLDRTYGHAGEGLQAVFDFLEDVAIHPATAEHIARKLAVHFVSDNPDPDLVGKLTDRYVATGGDLFQVYGALLGHPAAWDPELHNVKPPADYVASACRVLSVSKESLQTSKGKLPSNTLFRALNRMGQPFGRPPGPDGWPEEDGAWITPQGLAERLRFAMNIPSKLRPDLPDPRDFARDALGPRVSASVTFAAQAAESRADGIGLVLSSPAFQRR